MQFAPKYPEVLAAAKQLAEERPEAVTQHLMYKYTYDTVQTPEPFDIIAHLFAKFDFTPSPQWLYENNHRVARSWMNDLIADWAVQVFFSRLQRASDRGLTWSKAVKLAESQTKQYYRSFEAQTMIALMSGAHYYPGSTKPEDVLK